VGGNVFRPAHEKGLRGCKGRKILGQGEGAGNPARGKADPPGADESRILAVNLRGAGTRRKKKKEGSLNFVVSKGSETGRKEGVQRVMRYLGALLHYEQRL